MEGSDDPVNLSNSKKDPTKDDLEKILEGDLDTPQKDLEGNAESQKTPSKPIPNEPKLTPVSVVIEKMDSNLQNSTPVMKKRRKRKSHPTDAPKHPLTGYVRFMNSRRDSLKSENPEANHLDITKMLADEWTKMADEAKKPFMDEADKDKERFVTEMQAYRVLHPDAKMRHRKSKKLKCAPKAQSTPKIEEVVAIPAPVVPVPVENGTSKPPEASASASLLKAGHIPIFTDQFLEHNKQVESQLKALRKANTDFEFQNSNLERYIENMKSGIANMEADNGDLKAKNLILEKYLEKMRSTLAAAFGNLSLPTEKTATVSNIDSYMTELAGMSGPASTVNKAKDMLRKLDLQTTG